MSKQKSKRERELKDSSKKGFTLIELLVVVAVVSILAGTAIANLGGAREAARIARTLTWSASINRLLGYQAVGRWDFDENQVASGTGGIRDLVGGNSGTLNLGTGGNTILANAIVPGVTGNALSFDGVDDWVDMPDSTSLDLPANFTIDLWIMRAGDFGVTGKGILTKAPDTGANRNYFILGNPANMVQFSIGDGVSTIQAITGTTALTLNTWYHIVAVLDSSHLRIFVNGGNNAVPITRTINPSINTAPLNIGRMTPTSFTERYFNGLIDNVRIYAKAMPISYIQNSYAQGLKNLVASGQITEEEKTERLAKLEKHKQLALTTNN